VAEVSRAASAKARADLAAAAAEDQPEVCANAQPGLVREKRAFTRRNKRVTNDCRDAADAEVV